MLRWHQNRDIWNYLENHSYLPICVAWQLNSWRSAAVLQLLGLDFCASQAFSQEPDKSLSLITNDNLAGATMHVTFNQFAICIHYVHLLFWVMKNWKVITTWKSIMDNKWGKTRKSTINWSVVLVSTFKVIKAGNEIRQLNAFEIKQSIRTTTGRVPWLWQKFNHLNMYGVKKSFKKLFNYSFYLKKSKQLPWVKCNCNAW